MKRAQDLIKNTKLLASVKKNDVLYLHKITDQVDFMVLVLLRKWIGGRGFIVDFDDAIFLPTWNRAVKAWIMVRNADAVVVGSHYLQEYALRHNPRSYVISAPIDTVDLYKPAAKRIVDDRVRIGWTGTPGHYENMKLLLEPLRRLVTNGYRVVFVQLGGGDKINELLSSVQGLQIEYIPQVAWDQPIEVIAIMQQFDIGVMPLQRTEVNRGKDAWKAKEYMGCGVATILSNWGENPYVVTNDVNGILVDSEDDWYESFKKLVEDRAFRKKIGDASRDHMEAEYSYKAFVPKFLSATKLGA
ncbi:glycosyltransferase family 4 protein [Patescibacteria group bacterium]|nr:glycosyltransferase family 4 protein [Patescibacteria group bacterium]